MGKGTDKEGRRGKDRRREGQGMEGHWKKGSDG